MKNKKLWIISPFSNPTSPDSSDRYRYICQALTEEGASVCQFVSIFEHGRKQYRQLDTLPWRCVTVFEPGYNNNVSIRRILSHAVFDILILFYFIRERLRSGRPDTIFSVLPHNGAACVAAIFAKLSRARFIVDVHDTWPESILSVYKLNFATRIVYRFWKACADFPLICADMVFGESKRYAERANNVRNRFGRSPAETIYIGGDLSYYQTIKVVDIPYELRDASFIVAYAGTLGENYDLDCIVDAFVEFQKECPEAGLMFLGGGEREDFIKNKLVNTSVKAWVSGRIPYYKLIAYLKCSKVGLNCFKPGGNVAYSYKLNDYLLTGLPVINSLSGESADFVSKYNLGANYKASDTSSLLDALRLCHAQWIKNPNWSDHVREFAANNLNRKVSYQPLIQSCLRGYDKKILDEIK